MLNPVPGCPGPGPGFGPDISEVSSISGKLKTGDAADRRLLTRLILLVFGGDNENF